MYEMKRDALIKKIEQCGDPVITPYVIDEITVSEDPYVIAAELVDAIVIWGGSRAERLTLDEIEKFANSFF